MKLFEKEISPDPILGFRRLYEIDELSINSNSIFLHGSVFYLNIDGSKITKLKPYNIRLEAEKGKAPFVNPNTGAYTEPVYDSNNNITNNVISRYDYLNIIFDYVSLIVGDEVDEFVNKADLAGEFNI